jgi:hypothetical protein
VKSMKPLTGVLQSASMKWHVHPREFWKFINRRGTGPVLLAPQLGELFRSQLQNDLAESAPHYHREDITILQRFRPTGAARELDHRLIAVEEGEARELASVAVALEEAYLPPFVVGEGHQYAVLSRLRSGQLHSGIVGEEGANSELLVAGARGGGFLITRWLLVAPRGIGRLVVVFFAERATAGMLPIGGY